MAGKLEEDLRHNYADDVVLLTENSNARGHDAIRISTERLRNQLIKFVRICPKANRKVA